jgi:hypothetical protein
MGVRIPGTYVCRQKGVRLQHYPVDHHHRRRPPRARLFRARAAPLSQRTARPRVAVSSVSPLPDKRGLRAPLSCSFEAAGQGLEPRLPDPEMPRELRPAETHRDEPAPLRGCGRRQRRVVSADLGRSCCPRVAPDVRSQPVSEFPAGDELLAIFVRAERAGGGKRTRFHAQPDLTTGALVRHPELSDMDWVQGVLHCNRQDIDDLSERGFLRLDKRKRSVTTRGLAPKVYAEWWGFDVTPEGFQRIDELTLAAAPPAGAGHPGLQWETDVLPVLVAA